VLRTAWVAFVLVLTTIPCASFVILVSGFRRADNLMNKAIRFWAASLVWAAGVDLHAENADLIDPERRYILVANHYSYLDIPCIFTAVPHPIRFMAKVSLFKIPLFGFALRRAGFIPIDRKNRSTAGKSFEMAGERIRRGYTIVVFPEEGRSRERAMRPFQRGAFLLALKSQLPIVPTAIKGTFDVMPASTLRIKPGPVTVTLTPPIPTEGLSVRDRESLAGEARGRIAKILFGDAMEPPGSHSAPQPETAGTSRPDR
jgi:1-acyl-sn-glycerol-3-phosphate acyltransferase